MDDYLNQIANIVGSPNLLIRQAEIAPFCLDWRKRYHGHPLAVACPAHTEEIAELVVFCNEKKIPVVPQGGNTGLVGGATPDDSGRELVIAMHRMNRLRQLDSENNSMTVEAGMTLAGAQFHAQGANRLFPLSLASEGSCQIGGNLSTNAGGLCVLRYGTMRDLTLGLEVILPDGRIYNGLSGLRKDTSGYDIKQLFIGAEGSLGVITAATLKLFPHPIETITAMIGFNRAEEVITCLGRLRESFGTYLSTFEMIGKLCLDLVDLHIPSVRRPFVTPWTLLVEFTSENKSPALRDQVEDWLAKQSYVEVVVAQNEKDREDLWYLRESISEAQVKEGISIKHDIGMPSSAIPPFLDEAEKLLHREFPGCRIVVFGHAGDGNLHYNISQTRANNADLFRDEEKVNHIVYDLVYRYGGTLAAEHGIGQLKTEWLSRYKDPVSLSIMKAIKRTLDPNSIMNKNKVLR